jgi:Icc-related predicted phosphoesterase
VNRALAPLAIAFLFALFPPSCVRPTEERAERDLEVGHVDVGGVRFDVSGGLAAVRSASPGNLRLWASAPVFTLHVTASDAAERTWAVEIENILPDAELVPLQVSPGITVSPLDIGNATNKRWLLEVEPGTKYDLALTVADVSDRSVWRFAVLSDVQEAITKVQDVFAKINQQDVRFLLGAGDLTESGSVGELARYQDEMKTLEVPYYTTLGNHELGESPPPYQEWFGRANFHFAFRGVHFSLIDSGSATIDPMVYDWLDNWLDAGRNSPHVISMHIPPLDPIGVRNGSFASRNEGAKLLTRLAKGNVDLTVYGHIHSYYEFDNAGIPAYISGGGGAIPEKFDGVGRHILVVQVGADAGVQEVELVRVD